MALAGALPGQRAPDVRALAVEQLSAMAERWALAGFERRAAWLRYELLEEYEPDHEPTRSALGYARLPTGWGMSAGIPMPRDHGSEGALRELEKRWQKVCDELASAHRAALAARTNAGDATLAAWHAHRALRFDRKTPVPGSRPFEGVHGLPIEVSMWRRSRLLQQAVAFVAGHDFPCEELPADSQQPLVAAAGAYHRGVASRHFTVWGDLPIALLEAACQWSERSLLLSRTAFAGSTNYRDRPTESAQVAVFADRRTWRQVLETHSGLFEPAELAFLIENSNTAFLVSGAVLRVVNVGQRAHVLDDAVRGVAQDVADVTGLALDEGIGHAIVGMSLGRNLSFIVDSDEVAEGRTRVESASSRVDLLPELGAWLEHAQDLAWHPDRISVIELLRCEPHAFGVDERVWSWAVCDFALRRDPDLLRALDAAAAGRSAEAMAGAFAAASGGTSLEQFERDLRDHVRYSPPLPEDPRSDRVRELADATNAARLDAGAGFVAWIAAAPDAGDTPVTVARDLGGWWVQPTLRHLLLDARILALGCREQRDRIEVWPLMPTGEPSEFAVTWPADGANGVPTVVRRIHLEESARKALAAAAVRSGPRVGYPLTLHVLARDGGDPTDVKCVVRRGAEVIPGTLVMGARGLVTFYALSPLPSRAELEVEWSWSWPGGRRDESKTRFETQ